MRSWSYVPVGIWFNLKNTTGAPDDRVGNYGLLTQGGSAKPAFAAFRSVSDELAAGGWPTPAPPARTGKRHRRRVVVSVRRRHHYVVVKGTAPRRHAASLLVFKRDRRTGTFARRPSYRRSFPVNGRGHFFLRLRGRALSSGTWRIVVRPSGHRHWITAAAVLGA
jgi:hypothetical protein